MEAAIVCIPFTVGHGVRPLDELVAALHEAGVATLVDVRRVPGSRRNPQFNQGPLREALADGGIAYRHAVELGGRRSGEPGEERFACLGVAAFRSYAARMAAPEWQEALARSLEADRPCFLCAETLWWRCHRRLLADRLAADGWTVLHLRIGAEPEPHRMTDVARLLQGRLRYGDG